MCAASHTDTVPGVVERFLKALIVANKAVGLYPPSSTIPRDTSEEAAAVLREALRERSELVLGVTKDGMTFDGAVIVQGRAAYANFALELYNRRLAEVRFHVGTSPQDILALLSVVKLSPAEIDEAGGFESRLWERSVTSITVTEVRVTIVDAHSRDDAPLTRGQIDQALGLMQPGGGRDKIVLERFLGDPTAVAEYLGSLYEETGSHAQVAARFSLLAAIAEAGVEFEVSVPRTLADALSCIDATLRSGLLLDDILPEARENEQLAEVLRQIEVDDVFRMITAGVDPKDPPIGSLARAVRQVEALSLGSPGDIESAAGAAMRGAGMSESAVSDVLSSARPTKVTITPLEFEAERGDAPTVVTHAFTPLTDDELAVLPELEELRREAARGVTDGDVALALVALVAADGRQDRFAETMTSLEAALSLVVERGEIDAAADVAEALGAAACDPGFTPEQKDRLEAAVARLAKPGDVKAIVATLRTSPADSPERVSAARLLESLGPRAIEPMLEQLADEQDMAARKSLIDLLSGIAPRYITEVGEHVADSRWYVVRNVVSILGAARSSSAIPYLERTLRNPEPRVRRETIRALANINDRFAHQMLVSALTDDDPQNVQLAARYLGAARVDFAVPALERVAKGEGYGNRDSGPRVEAIESLGRMGAVSALPTLEALAGRRSLLQGGKMREIRTAAEAAVQRVKTRGGTA